MKLKGHIVVSGMISSAFGYLTHSWPAVVTCFFGGISNCFSSVKRIFGLL